MTVTNALSLELREMLPGDRNYIHASWSRSYAETSADAKAYAGKALGKFGQDYSPVISNLIDRSTCLVASLQGTEDAIVGFMAWEGGTLHYVHVKRRWQRLGVARWMLTPFLKRDVTFTHVTRAGVNLLTALGVQDSWTYRRWLIFPREAA